MLRWLGAASRPPARDRRSHAVGSGSTTTTPGPLAANKIVVIPHGSGVGAVAETLARNGVIRHPWVFIAGAAVDRRVGALKAGEYDFAAAISPRAVAALVASGRVVQHSVTVPEGLTSAEIVALLARESALDGIVAATPARGQPAPRHLLLCAGRRTARTCCAHASCLRACAGAALGGAQPCAAARRAPRRR